VLLPEPAVMKSPSLPPKMTPIPVPGALIVSTPPSKV
jgi:hypothetical protein